jgi:hypothetical protein
MAGKEADAIWKGLSYGGLGFGALAVLAPRVFNGLYGLKGDGNLRAMVRLWGTRTALIGAMALTTTDPAAQRRLGMAVVGLNAVDTALTLTAGPDVPARTRVMGAASSAAFAAASGYWLSQGGS